MMSDKPTTNTQFYVIRLKGHLDAQWMTWFDNLIITLEENGDTLLSGPIADQAALHGLLKKVRDLGMPLVSVAPVQFKQSEQGEKMNASQKIARIAGLLYLIYIVIHVLADVIGRSKIIVYGDAVTTTENIMAFAWQFRIGFMLDLFAAVFFLLTAWALYRLLKPVNESMALLFLLLNAGGVAIQMASDLFLPVSQMLMSGADYSKVFQPNQLQALAMSFLYLYKNGFMIAQIFYGAWLFPLGYVIFRSGFLPKLLGTVLMIHCCTWLMNSLQFFLFPGFTVIAYVSYPLGFIAEFGLALWLLIKGAKVQKPA